MRSMEKRTDSSTPATIVLLADKVLSFMLDEVALYPGTETGGVYLGYRNRDIVYVVECVDPGWNGIHTRTDYEYDREYVDHCSNRLRRLYRLPLEQVGIWHRHPGNMDIFSSIDEGVNRAYASMHVRGSISALVNIDPNIRITMYSVQTAGRGLQYDRIKCIIGDEYIPSEYARLTDPDKLIREIEAAEAFDRCGRLSTSIHFIPRKLKQNESVLPGALKNRRQPITLESLLSAPDVREIVPGSIEEGTWAQDVASSVDTVVAALDEDMSFMGNLGLDIRLRHIASGTYALEEQGGDFVSFKCTGDAKVFMSYDNRIFEYRPGLLASLIKQI